MAFRSLSSAGTVRHLTGRNVKGGGVVSNLLILALLALAMFFYYRAMTQGEGHGTQTARQDEAATTGESSATADQHDDNQASALVQTAAATAESKQEAGLDPKLVQGLNAVIKAPQSTGAEIRSGLAPVPAAQVDLIKQVFAPELLK